MAISQILYGRYHIWDSFGICRTEDQIFFLLKKQPNTQNHALGTHNAKMGAVQISHFSLYVKQKHVRTIYSRNIYFTHTLQTIDKET